MFHFFDLSFFHFRPYLLDSATLRQPRASGVLSFVRHRRFIWSLTNLFFGLHHHKTHYLIYEVHEWFKFRCFSTQRRIFLGNRRLIPQTLTKQIISRLGLGFVSTLAFHVLCCWWGLDVFSSKQIVSYSQINFYNTITNIFLVFLANCLLKLVDC